MRMGVPAALLTMLALVACAKKPEPPAPAGAAETPAQAPAPAPVSSALISGDAAGLRNYLSTVQETPARRFDVQWNPDVVPVDRAAALRTLHGISRDGATFRFAAGDPALAALAPGRILFLWGIAVRRVSAVQTVNGELVVSTTEASLSEIFRNANIEIDYALRPQSPLVVPHVQVEDPPAAAPPAAAHSEPRAAGFMRVRYAAEPPAPTSGGGNPPTPPSQGGSPTPTNGGGNPPSPPSQGGSPTPTNGGGNPPAPPSQGGSPSPSGGGGISPNPPGAPGAPAANAPQPGDTVLPLGLDSWGVKGYHGFDITAKYGPVGDGIAFDLQARLAQSDLGDDMTQGSIIGKGSDLWDLRIGATGKLKAAATNDTLRVASNIVIKDSALALMRTDFSNVNGQLALFFVARRGEMSEQWISSGRMKIELPIRFNIPVIIGGLPMMFQVAFNFIAQPALTTKNDSFTARVNIPFNGNATVTYDKGKVTSGGTMQSLPQVLEAFGSSIGVSAILVALQAPRVGLGLGLFSSSSVGYIDLVNTFTITSGGELGMFPCKNHQLVATVNAGIDTQIALPLDGWAKLLGKPLSSTLADISKAASVRQQVYKKEWYRNEPDIKACVLK